MTEREMPCVLVWYVLTRWRAVVTVSQQPHPAAPLTAELEISTPQSESASQQQSSVTVTVGQWPVPCAARSLYPVSSSTLAKNSSHLAALGCLARRLVCINLRGTFSDQLIGSCEACAWTVCPPEISSLKWLTGEVRFLKCIRSDENDTIHIAFFFLT